jgi:hypothetical protein
MRQRLFFCYPGEEKAFSRWRNLNAGNDSKMKMHFSLLIGFLIVAHIAMIFGMLNPAIL